MISKRRPGFTLIELLIVILVIAILALIVTNRLMAMSRKAHDSTLRDNIMQVREAVAQFAADTGANPAKLTDIVATTPPATGVDDNGNSIAIPTGFYLGPYLTLQGGIGGAAIGIPINPFTPLVNGVIDHDPTHHWTYVNGVVSPAAPTSGNTLDGTPYSSL